MSEPARPDSEVSVTPYRQRIIERYTVKPFRAFMSGVATGGFYCAFFLGSALMAVAGFSDVQIGCIMGAGLVVCFVLMLKLGLSMSGSDERDEYRRLHELMARTAAEQLSWEDAKQLHLDLISKKHGLYGESEQFAWEVLIQKRVVPRGQFF